MAAGQRIVEILHAIKNAAEASTRELNEIKAVVQANGRELVAIRRLLETNTAHQSQRMLSARPLTQHQQDDEGDEKQPEERGKDENTQGSGLSGYSVYREKQKPQTPGVIHFVQPGQSTRRSSNYSESRYESQSWRMDE